MKKKFNITGLCFPDQHYMADVSKKLARAYDMIEDGDYFIINRPRQYGKTTSLHTLANTLRGKGDYLVVHTSFGGVGEKIFTDEQTFSTGFVKLLSVYADKSASEIAAWLNCSY